MSRESYKIRFESMFDVYVSRDNGVDWPKVFFLLESYVNEGYVGIELLQKLHSDAVNSSNYEIVMMTSSLQF